MRFFISIAIATKVAGQTHTLLKANHNYRNVRLFRVLFQ